MEIIFSDKDEVVSGLAVQAHTQTQSKMYKEDWMANDGSSNSNSRLIRST